MPVYIVLGVDTLLNSLFLAFTLNRCKNISPNIYFCYEDVEHFASQCLPRKFTERFRIADLIWYYRFVGSEFVQNLCEINNEVVFRSSSRAAKVFVLDFKWCSRGRV